MQHSTKGRGGRHRGGFGRPKIQQPARQHSNTKLAASHPTDKRPSCREFKLFTNAYSIITANREIILHEYELFVQPSQGCKDIPPEVLSKTFVCRSLRQLIMTELIPCLLKTNSSLGGVVIGPSLEAIYSTQPLFNQNISKDACSSQEEMRFERVNVRTDLLRRLKVDIVIKFQRTFKVSPHSYNASLQNSIIHHQLTMKMPRYGSVYFPSSETPRHSQTRLDLISRHLMGISISGARRNVDNQMMIVVNCSHSYITQSYPLISLLASFLAERPVEEFELHDLLKNMPQLTMVRGNEEWLATFCSILTGFKCRAVTPDGSEMNLRFELTEQPAGSLLLDDGTPLLEHYRRLGATISYPTLPCLKSRSLENPYLPMESCNLLSGQKVPMFRLSSAARNHMVMLHKPHPTVTSSMSSKARDEVVSINKAQFDAFGLQLSEKPLETVGRALKKPSLQYRDQMIDPIRDYWESATFYQSIDLIDNWCVVDTVGMVGDDVLTQFLAQFTQYANQFGLRIGAPYRHSKSKQEILSQRDSIESLIDTCGRLTPRELRFVMFIIDSASTQVNRMIHLAFDDHPYVTATCVRSDSILNQRQRRSIYRTLVHKLNTRLGGTNYTYNTEMFEQLSMDPKELMVVGLDVTHPDNELNGVSIVGCAYTYCGDLFRHKSLVWPQEPRKEIITKMDMLVNRLLNEFAKENAGQLPKQLIIFRDGVSNEEFERVKVLEIAKAQQVIETVWKNRKETKTNLSYIIAQKRHTMRFFQKSKDGRVHNPPGGTLIDHEKVTQDDREFYLYSNTSPQATARPVHYHVLLNGLGLDNLKKLTYYLCFNFGKCSSSLSMPSSLRYAHNAAYDARNRVIASKEFSENKFYTTKFFC